MTRASIRVVVVDDHHLVRMSIVAILAASPDMELVGQGVNGLEAIQLCEQFQPDVLLLDLHMPRIDGLTAIPPIRQCSPNTHIIVLSNFVEDDIFKKVLAAGAVSYLAKDLSINELVYAIRNAVQGKPIITDKVIRPLQEPAHPNIRLTTREHEILVLITRGLTNGEIGDQLHLAIPTVKAHMNHILNKLQAKTRAEAVVLALKYNLIQIPAFLVLALATQL